MGGKGGHGKVDVVVAITEAEKIGLFLHLVIFYNHVLFFFFLTLCVSLCLFVCLFLLCSSPPQSRANNGPSTEKDESLISKLVF